ncbi:PREDICTED: protein RALF-like 9 [Camelina sativa]|uniref:Protein RALF-like 9 n=1 Tax=Camelina sativa TaxID=90675 RepID=A0ABM1RP54_CAMSA|nr:PREDICTED: protein RALF-like 9 [Camelina sativa]
MYTMLKKISVLYLLLLIIFSFEAATIKMEIVISYDAMRVNHAWGCSPKHPQFCQKTKVNPYTIPITKNSEALQG